MNTLLPYAAPLGRALLALIFIVAGLQKLGDVAGTAACIESGGLPGFLVWPTILLEVVGGLFVLVGYRATLAALTLAAFSVVSGILYHLVPAFAAEGVVQQVQIAMFLKNLAIAGGFLIVAALGAGIWSVKGGGGKPALA
jgi:putative oxidoreductase